MDKADWHPAGGLHLEPNALRSATETEASVLVVAGPGAGKSEMLAQRADFLLRTGECPYPRRILAISFKTDAAQNLRARVAARCGSELSRRLDSHTFHAFAKRLIDRYRVVLTAEDALDRGYTVGDQRVGRSQITFNDMVPLAREILRSSASARNAIRNTYSHVFLDEFQDCTNVQYDFVIAAFERTATLLTAVGDEKQTIMRYAGALDGIFERFRTDVNANVRHLYQNYRSAPSIRRVQNEMVKVMDSDAAVADDELAGDDGTVDVFQYDSCTDEAADLAKCIQSWIKEDGVLPAEIAVLVRNEVHDFACSLMDALDDRNIQYRNEQQVQDDFAQPIGELVRDFITVTVHTRQPAAYKRLTDRLTAETGVDEIDERNAARWREFIRQARARIQASMDDESSAPVLLSETRRFLRTVGNDQLVALSPEYATGSRLADLTDSVLTLVSELAEGIGGSLNDLTHVIDDGAVRILTIHKAKGLEFDTVVVLGVEHETFWGDAHDARATFFVAISRAKRRLILTTAEYRAKPPGRTKRWDARRRPHEEFLSYVEDELD